MTNQYEYNTIDFSELVDIKNVSRDEWIKFYDTYVDLEAHDDNINVEIYGLEDLYISYKRRKTPNELLQEERIRKENQYKDKINMLSSLASEFPEETRKILNKLNNTH
jgi:hypothetical protein